MSCHWPAVSFDDKLNEQSFIDNTEIALEYFVPFGFTPSMRLILENFEMSMRGNNF